MPYPLKEYNINLLSEDNIKKHVLPHYGFHNAAVQRIKFKNTDKQRAVYKITVSEKNYCLKKVYFLEKDLLFIYSAIEWFFKHNIYVPKILSTNTGNRFVKFNNMLFILTPWIEGSKCDYENKNHIVLSINNLAQMHNAAKGFYPIQGSNILKNFTDMPHSLDKHFHQILYYSNLASKYNDKFSRLFLQHFNINFLLAKISTRVSSTILIENLNTCLCHMDYVNKNIILDKNNKIWVIDFDKCSINYSCQDISYFLRRLLRRDSTNWNLDIAISCLNSYEKIHPLNLDEYKYIFSYLSFPQKFWKLSRDYFNNLKKCNHDSFFYLLKKSLEHDADQLEFMFKFGKHIENKFKIKLT